MDLAELNRWLAERNLNGHWNWEPPSQRMKAFLWKWKDIEEGLKWAGELITAKEAGRRTIQLRNPSLQGAMTNTIHISVQMVRPGEIATAHRHVAAAIRFVIKGSLDCFTIVQGERFPMGEGDLITTPNWTWHDHYNGSDEPVIWLDGLDVRMVSYFGSMFQENFHREQQPVEKPDHYSSTVLGRARPTWIKHDHPAPPFRYQWNEIYASLLALKQSDGDPYDGIQLQYVNVSNGGPTLATFSCMVQLLRSKEKTRPHRHTSTTVYQAFRGTGQTTVEGENLRWGQGDIFVVPPWQWHSHKNPADGDAILFSITDRPAMEALGLYREEGSST